MSALYKTERLETYDWGKELRLKHLKGVVTAKDEGRFLVVGNMNFPKELLTGLGDFAYLAGEPWAVSINHEGGPELSAQCLEEVERRGYARDLCGYMRVYWGSLFLNRSPWGGFPTPDLVVFQSDCDSRGKWYQKVSEYLGVPWNCVEGTYHSADGTTKTKEHALQYLIGQYTDFIEWLERTFHNKYDYGKLLEATANAYRSRAYWGEIVQLQGAIPAPLDYKLLLPFYMAIEYYAYEPECVAMMKALRDEVKYRVDNQIAAVPNESCRVMHEGLAPWYALYLFTYIRQRGVTVVGGSHHYNFILPVQQPTEDGSFAPENPVYWEGVPKTWEEGVRFRAMHQLYVEKVVCDTRLRARVLQTSQQSWKAQGIIFMYDRGCEFFNIGQPEVKAALQRDGVHTMVYETNRVDAGEWSWTQVQDATDAFLEALGVPQLVN
jgi:benzoyl-CoA reductase subunit B